MASTDMIAAFVNDSRTGGLQVFRIVVKEPLVAALPSGNYYVVDVRRTTANRDRLIARGKKGRKVFRLAEPSLQALTDMIGRWAERNAAVFAPDGEEEEEEEEDSSDEDEDEDADNEKEEGDKEEGEKKQAARQPADGYEADERPKAFMEVPGDGSAPDDPAYKACPAKIEAKQGEIVVFVTGIEEE
jgi:hypothetical protein